MERQDTKTVRGYMPEQSQREGWLRSFEAGRMVRLEGTHYEVDLIVAGLCMLRGDLIQKRAVNLEGSPIELERVEELLDDIENPNYVESELLPDGLWPE